MRWAFWKESDFEIIIEPTFNPKISRVEMGRYSRRLVCCYTWVCKTQKRRGIAAHIDSPQVSISQVNYNGINGTKCNSPRVVKLSRFDNTINTLLILPGNVHEIFGLSITLSVGFSRDILFKKYTSHIRKIE